MDGRQRISIESDLIFSHPAMENDLIIRSGAHSIFWSYELNTQSTPTIGGEVIQVLSCFVGPMTIVGEAAGMHPDRNPYTSPIGWGAKYTPVNEMEDIVKWFLTYMELAGTKRRSNKRRNETAITFIYPARGWEFLIQIVALEGFDVAVDKPTIPWSITAEIVSDRALDYFVAATMNTFTDSILNKINFHSTITRGFEFERNPFLNPELNRNFSGSLAQRIGDNFQALIASWAAGDFMNWGWDVTGNNASLPSDPYNIYGNIYGGWFIGDKRDFSDWGADFSNISGPDSGSYTYPVTSGEMLSGKQLYDFITCEAKDRKLDPAAVLAVAEGEGLNGGIGDRNADDTTFSVGPWQLYYPYGKLPKEIGQKGMQAAQEWAFSPEGIRYALDGIARVASGLTGFQAIEVIIIKFEEPVNPSKSIEIAKSRYGKWLNYTNKVDCSVVRTPGIIIPEVSNGPAELNPGLWGIYKAAIDQGFVVSSMSRGNAKPGTTGVGSDHNFYPSYALDIAITPKTGWNNQKARSFFMALIKHPIVAYVILGDRIWSAKRAAEGIRPWTEDRDHFDHIHVSMKNPNNGW
ncbi:MAG: hypothetical protein QXY15_10335 [Candidatus Nitrosotenuis sp.]